MKSLKNKKFLILGGTGFLGKNLANYLKNQDAFYYSVGSKTIDLSKSENMEFVFSKEDFDYIIHAAVLQGAGDWPLTHTAEQFDINCRIHANVLKAWKEYSPNAKMIGIGSSCSYPGHIPILKEEDYWNGAMHESIDIYGLTKKIMSTGIEAYKRQYGLKGTTVIFATLFGPHDSFDREKSHVVSALIRKFVEAEQHNYENVEIWGDGTQTRELIYVEDQIKGLHSVLDYEGEIINIGTGIEITIKELAERIKELTSFKGNVVYNDKKFVGVKNKVLDVSLAKTLYGWMDIINIDTLDNNLRKTINWFKKNQFLIK